MFEQFATSEEQKQLFILGGFEGKRRTAFGLTEPDHGSDATHMETRAVRQTRDGVDGWLINGEKMWTTGMHVATHCATFCRTSWNDGEDRKSTSELQSLMRISYAVFCLKKKTIAKRKSDTNN